jgi:hypothetical protein
MVALEKNFSNHPHGEGLFIAYPPTKARNYALFFTSEGAFRVDAKNVITSLDPNAISGIQEGFGKVKIPGVPNDFNFAFGDSQGGHTSSSYSSVDPKTGQVVNFSEQHEMPSYFEDESGWDGFKKQQVKDLGTAEPFADSDELLKFSLNAALKNIDFEIEEKKKNGRYKDSKDELKLDSRALSSCNVPDAAMQRQIDARVANLNSLTQPFGRFRALPNDTAVSAGSMGGEKP